MNWPEIKLGLDPKLQPSTDFEAMRREILKGTEDSALIRQWYCTCHSQGLSGEDRYVLLAFTALTELERHYRRLSEVTAILPATRRVTL